MGEILRRPNYQTYTDFEDGKLIRKLENHQLILGAFNIASMPKNFDAFYNRYFLFFLTAHVLVFEETRLTKKLDKDFQEKAMEYGFKAEFCNRDRKGGGVAIFVRNDIPYKKKNVPTEYYENITICLETAATLGKDYIVSGVYRPQKVKRRQLLNDPIQELAKFTALKTVLNEVIILGDMNIDHQEGKNESYSAMLRLSGLMNVIRTYTRVVSRTNKKTGKVTTSKTIVDHILVSSPEDKDMFSAVLSSKRITDHFCVVLGFTPKEKTSPGLEKPVPEDPCVKDKFKELLSTLPRSNELMQYAFMDEKDHLSKNKLFFNFFNDILGNLKMQNHSIVLFIDFRRALKVLNTNRLVKTVVKAAGTTDDMKAWLRTYFTDGQQDEEQSHSKLIQLLHAIYINELQKSVKCRSFAYGGNVAFLVEGESREEAETTAQEIVYRVCDWCRRNGLEIDGSELKPMFIFVKKVKPITKLRMRIFRGDVKHEVDVEFVSEHCYLGVTIDQKLKWMPKTLQKKIEKIISIVKETYSNQFIKENNNLEKSSMKNINLEKSSVKNINLKKSTLKEE